MTLLQRPVVLTFLEHYLPGFKGGGPIRSLAAMAEQLSDTFEFRIVTADRDFGGTGSYPDIAVNQWNRVGEAQVFYRSPGWPGWRAFLKAARDDDYDLMYLSGVFSPDSSFLPLIYARTGRLRRGPVLVAPRGQLSPGALSIRGFKKRAFLKLAKATGLFKGAWWDCSNTEEADEVRLHLGVRDGKILIAPNLSGKASSDADDPVRRDGKLRIAFLSRVSPKKNLDGALKILAMVKTPVEFEIFGPIEDLPHWKNCENLIRNLPGHVAVNYGGEVHPDDVEATLRPFDLFLFPTHGENYGHVIREALSSGLPVLLSDLTPWRGLEEKGAGADLPLDDLARFARWIDDFAGLDETERQKRRASARAVGNDPVAAAANLEANRVMLSTAIGMTRLSGGARGKTLPSKA